MPPLPPSLDFCIAQRLESSSSDSVDMVLFPVDGKNYNVGGKGISVWDDFRVFNSRPDVFWSLSLDEQNKRCVRKGKTLPTVG